MADLSNLIPEGYSLAVLRWGLPSGRVGTVNIGFEQPGAVTLQQVANELFTITKAEWAAITDTSYTFLPTICYTNVGAGIVTAVATGATAPGTQTKNSAPCEINVGIRKRTGFIGKGFRGRSYWPIGLNEASVDEGGALLSSTITTVQGVLDSWVDETTNPVNNTVLSWQLFRNPTPANPDADRVALEITAWDISPVCTSQRRRRTRV